LLLAVLAVVVADAAEAEAAVATVEALVATVDELLAVVTADADCVRLVWLFVRAVAAFWLAV
jgi:hypothetical protein